MNSASLTFSWSNPSSTEQGFYVFVGITGIGSSDIASLWTLTNQLTVSDLPTNGETVYVKLWTLIDEQWQFNSYTYTALNGINSGLQAATQHE